MHRLYSRRVSSSRAFTSNAKECEVGEERWCLARSADEGEASISSVSWAKIDITARRVPARWFTRVSSTNKKVLDYDSAKRFRVARSGARSTENPSQLKYQSGGLASGYSSRSYLRSRLARTAWATRGCAESSVNFGADECLRMSGPPRDQVERRIFFPRGHGHAHTGKHS